MGKKNSNKGEVALNQTSKFSVLDAPGVAQPKVVAAPKAASTNDGAQGRRAKASTGPRMDDSTTTLIGGGCFEKRSANPEWLKVREDAYATISARREEELAKKTPVEIKCTMPDGNVLEQTKAGESFMAWKTSPYDVACVISQGLADSTVVARVTYADYVKDYDLAEDGMDGEDLLAEAMEQDVDEAAKAVLWDMTRPLVGNVSKLEFLKFDGDPDAKTVFWHSSAHMLGEALEHLFGSRLTIGPPLKGGFYYDSYMGSDSLKEDDYTSVETEVKKITKKKQKFHRLVVTKDECLELFAGNPFKEQIIKSKIPDGTRTTVYKCGDLIDLCRGPHVPHTGRIKAFAATRHSATSWLGDTENDSLQRMYGISFPDKKMLKVWKENQEKVC